MARRIATETKASAFLNITLKDAEGNVFTLGGKALPCEDLPRGNALPNKVVRKIWTTASEMQTGTFDFPTHGSFENFLRATGLSIELTVRRTDDVATSDDGGDDIEF